MEKEFSLLLHGLTIYPLSRINHCRNALVVINLLAIIYCACAHVIARFVLMISQPVAATTVFPKFLKFWSPPHDLVFFLIVWILEAFWSCFNFGWF